MNKITNTLFIFLFTSFSFKASAELDHFQEKLKEVLEDPYFNGRWVDSWGNMVTVKNEVTFPAPCHINFHGVKASKLSTYKLSANLDFSANNFERVEKSLSSNSVKLVLTDNIVESSIINHQRGTQNFYQEKIVSFFYTTQDQNEFYEVLIDTLRNYYKYCE